MTPELKSLHPELVAFCCEGLAEKHAVAGAAPGAPSVVGAALAFNPFTLALIESTVKGALEFAAATWGSTGVAITLAYKDQIRAIIGPQVLNYVDTIVHGLQDAKPA